MIIDKNGQPVRLDSTITVRGTDYTVMDIDGDVIIASAKGNGVQRRFNIATLGMINSDCAQDKRRKLVEARIKLRDYWES